MSLFDLFQYVNTTEDWIHWNWIIRHLNEKNERYCIATESFR